MNADLVRRAHGLAARGATVRASAPVLGVSPATVARALTIRPLCTRCDSRLLKLPPDGLCGFCREEDKPEGDRL